MHNQLRQLYTALTKYINQQPKSAAFGYLTLVADLEEYIRLTEGMAPVGRKT